MVAVVLAWRRRVPARRRGASPGSARYATSLPPGSTVRPRPASVTDGPRRGSPASPFPWSGCGPHRVGQSSCRVARMRPRVGPAYPGRSRKIPGSKLLIAFIGGACRLSQEAVKHDFPGGQNPSTPPRKSPNGGKTPTKSLEPPSAVGATKKPSKHRGLSRIRPALSHLVPHPKTFGRAQEVQTGESGADYELLRLIAIELRTFIGRLRPDHVTVEPLAANSRYRPIGSGSSLRAQMATAGHAGPRIRQPLPEALLARRLRRCPGRQP